MHINPQKVEFLRRAIAYLIDIFLVIIPIAILSYVFINSEYVADVLIILAIVLYNILLLNSRQATIGKRLLGLKVISVNGNHLGLVQILLRESVGRMLSGILNLGYLWVIVDKNNQAWHDKLAGTQVVKTDSENEIKEKQIGFVHWLAFFVLALAFSGIPLLISIYMLVQPVKVKGNTMTPFYQNGDFYLVNKLSYIKSTPKRGDVIVFETTGIPESASLEYSPQKNMFIKRIVGLPGDRIKIETGSIYINDVRLDEPYLGQGELTNPGAFLTEGTEFVVPEKSYIVLGDNRDRSSDSRSWGPIKEKDIIGKLWFKYGAKSGL